MSVEGKVQIKMRASVGTLRSQGTYWVEEDRAEKLVASLHASYLVAPALVGVIDAITSVAAEMRDGHRLDVAPGSGSAGATDQADAAPEKTEEVQADGTKGDQSASKARTRSRPGNGNGRGDQAGRLDESANGKQG